MSRHYSKDAFVTTMRAYVARHAEIADEEDTTDDTPVSSPAELVAFLTATFNKTFVCEDLSKATTFGGAKRNIVPLFPRLGI
jgi:hypothetical protein